MTDKDMALEAADIIRTVAGNQKGIKKAAGRLLNKICYIYHRWI